MNWYRKLQPISNLSCLSKIYFILKNKLFSSVHFGFRERKGTIDVTINLINLIINCIGNRGLITCDLSKAFDTVYFKTFDC